MEFSRPARLPAPVTAEGDVVVEAPPEIPRAVPVHPLARLLPVVMIVATIGMMSLYFSSGAGAVRNPMFMFFPVTMLISVLGTLAFSARGTGRAAEINEDRRDYLRYLGTLDAAAAAAAHAQHRSRHWMHPSPAGLWTLVGSPRMWERGPDDADFGSVRVGLGAQPLCTRLVGPELGPVDELDPVTALALRRLIRCRSVVPDVPITVVLNEFAVVSVDGAPEVARGLVRAMLAELAVLHGPDHLALVAVLDAPAEPDWDWLKWLPHHRDPATDGGLVYRTLADAERHGWGRDGARPAHVVAVLDGGLVTGAERWCGPEEAGGVTLLAVGPPPTAVRGPVLRMRIEDGVLSVGDEVSARPDTLTVAEAVGCARRLAPFRPGRGAPDEPLAASTGWADLLRVGDPGRIDPGTAWRARGAGERLRVPIGVSDDGAPVELDLKEAAEHGMGPHGLCIGATGSGKSEFLRTLTLGLLATHPPDALNVVLVDFKGGATFLGFERAPQVSAVITNLADEAHLVARMRDALAGEMNRRQELLRSAGGFANIADYDRARDRGADLAPLPVLLVVVDEFSELLSQHPEFAELFVAIGRLGRSLGVHLLLASQRLDEGRLRGLETHLSYRVCLKTFSANESRAVLGVPDAYQLPGQPGVAYLRTVAGELTRFRTAFVSGAHRCVAPPAPRPDVPPAPRLFTAAGDRVDGDEPPASSPPPTSRTVFETVVGRLAGHGTPAHRVWLPPLADSPALDGVLASAGPDPAPLTVPIGLIDSPFDQRRDALVAALAGSAGNVAVVGGPHSGKSTALRTLVLALAATHDPRDVQVYCLDFGGGGLESLRALPQVGSVAGRPDRDLVRRTIAELESVVRSREARFRRCGIDSIAEYRRRRAAGDPAATDDRFGDVFLVIDGWGAVRQDFDGLEAPITALAAQGLSYGVHVVVSASRWAELRPALKDQLGTRIELRLGDPAESEMDRKRARYLTDSPPGRGLTRDGRELVIALPRLDGWGTATGLAEALTGAAGELTDRYGGRRAPTVELLPDRVPRRVVAARRPGLQVALGLGERELQPVVLDFAEQSHLIVLGEAECGKTATLRALCAEIVETRSADAAQLLIVDFRRSLLGVVESSHLLSYAMSAAALTSQLGVLLDRLRVRMPGDGVTQQQLRSRSWWSGPELYVVVDDYDLVAGATGNPLTPLVDYLPHAKDLGLHVVVARRSGGAARAMFDPLLARLRDLGCMGLMMSASPEEGVLLGSVRPGALPPGRGTLITRNQPDQLVQVAWCDPP